jgi:hypothetical protein
LFERDAAPHPNPLPVKDGERGFAGLDEALASLKKEVAVPGEGAKENIM